MMQGEITKLARCVEFVTIFVSNKNLSSATLGFLKRNSVTLQNGMMKLKRILPSPPSRKVNKNLMIGAEV